MSTSRRRRSYLDPDFGIKASLNLASRKRSKCRLKSEATSEIPELGLDSALFNIDCDVNPARVAIAAARVARTYGKYRQDRKRNRSRPQESVVKRKRTRINIDYEKDREKGVYDNRTSRSKNENHDDDD